MASERFERMKNDTEVMDVFDLPLPPFILAFVVGIVALVMIFKWLGDFLIGMIRQRFIPKQ